MTLRTGVVVNGSKAAKRAGVFTGVSTAVLLRWMLTPPAFWLGDVRAGADRRIAAAVGEGSAAIFSVHQYLRTV